MIISGLLKNWRTILDVLLVITVIVLIFLINPFKFFGSGLKLENTANLVSQVQEIGELTTAEYYGEVIASYPEAVVEVIDQNDLSNRAQQIYQDIKLTIYREYTDRKREYDQIKKRRKWKIIRNKKLKQKDNQVIDQVYDYINTKYLIRKDLLGLDLIVDEVFMYMKKEVRRESFKVRKFREEKKDKKSRFWREFRRDQIRKELANIKTSVEKLNQADLTAYLNQPLSGQQSFVEFYNWYGKKQLTRRQQKTNLAVIGRGWVKAGFRFDQLNERNFVYDEANQAVHFFGFRAEILDKDINPWFIPQERVPGFEIIAAGNANFGKMKEVKAFAKNKLGHSAREAGIVEQAQLNGQEALKTFFTLVTGDEIKNVFFHKDNLIYLAESILENDNVISAEELELIDSLYKRNLALIQTEENPSVKRRREDLLSQFIAELRASDGIETPIFNQLPLNMFSRHLPAFYEYSVLSLQEIDSINAMRWEFTSTESPGEYFEPEQRAYHKYWFSNELEYLHQYNQFIDLLKYLHVKDTITFRNNQRTALVRRLEDSVSFYLDNDAQYSLRSVLSSQ